MAIGETVCDGRVLRTVRFREEEKTRSLQLTQLRLSVLIINKAKIGMTVMRWKNER